MLFWISFPSLPRVFIKIKTASMFVYHSIRLIPIISIGKINPAVFYTKNFSHAAHIHVHAFVGGTYFYPV